MLASDQKQMIRKDLLLRRTYLSKDEKFIFDQRIQNFCRVLLKEYQPAVAAGYNSLNQEASLEALYFSKNQKWAFPVVVGNQLNFCLVKESHNLKSGSFGILEPDSNCPEIDLSECSIVFIPGVAFDRDGKRLGMGKGYYDRALANYSGVKVGVCFKLQLLEDALPQEAHDIEMDHIVTEDFILSPIHNKRLN